jgi:hypothetical protein
MKNWEERTVDFSVGYFSGFGGWLYCCRGHQVARSFGLGGQDSFQYPRAREPDRLLLAGWVVSRFWIGFGQCIRLGKAAERTTRSAGSSIRQRYFYF